LVFVPVLFNIFIRDINDGIKCTLSKLADDTKLCGSVSMPERQDAIQRDPHRIKQSTWKNLMRFNKSKCKVLHLGHGNTHYQYKLEDVRTKINSAEKD